MSDLAPGINLRLANLPGGGSAFVEIEDDHGRSIKAGTVTRGEDGEWSIRITAADLEGLPTLDARRPVVHLDDPRPDFAAMTRPQLRDLRNWIVGELRQRRELGLPDQPSERDDRPSSVPPIAVRVLGAKRKVIGWVWPDPVNPQLYWCAAHVATPDHVQSVPNQHHLSARDRAIAWVLGKDGNQLMAEEADRG